jgi:hypothetical protein
MKTKLTLLVNGAMMTKTEPNHPLIAKAEFQLPPLPYA